MILHMILHLSPLRYNAIKTRHVHEFETRKRLETSQNSICCVQIILQLTDYASVVENRNSTEQQ
jgi:hypothetical protein